MNRGKSNKIQFLLCYILFATQVCDAIGPALTESTDKLLILSDPPSPSSLKSETPSSSSALPEVDKIIRDENRMTKNCGNSSDIATNITMSINVNDTEKMNKILKVIDEKLNLTNEETLEGFDDIKRIKKEISVTPETGTQSPKILKKKETGHGKFFLLSSIISNGNVINGNIDTSNYDHINKRNSKDDANHVWKYRKPVKFQKIMKPALNPISNNPDSGKVVYEIYSKNPNHGGEAHDNKKITPILPARFETVNSNVLIDYLFPSMFKNIFSQINRQYVAPTQTEPFNEIGYADKLIDSWLNLKEENTVPIKCTCNRMKNLDAIESNLNNKLYPKEKFGMLHIIPHVALYKQDSPYENTNGKEPNDKTVEPSL